jgi:hypothetical protein
MTDLTFDPAAAKKAVEHLASMMATNSRDWGAARDDAWFYGLVVGWSDEDPDDPEWEDCLPELGARHGWTQEAQDNLRALHAGFASVPALLDALAAAREELAEAQREVWALNNSDDGRVVLLESLIARMRPVLEYVSRGRSFVGVDGPYPDATARRVLAELTDSLPPAAVPGDGEQAATADELCTDKNGFHDGHDWTPDPCEPYRWCPGYPVPRAALPTSGQA